MSAASVNCTGIWSVPVENAAVVASVSAPRKEPAQVQRVFQVFWGCSVLGCFGCVVEILWSKDLMAVAFFPVEMGLCTWQNELRGCAGVFFMTMWRSS